MTTEDLKKQEAERKQKEIEENQTRLKEVLPIFEAELKVLCEKHQVAIEGFMMIGDRGIQPEIRIIPIKKIVPSGDPQNPYDVA